MSESHLGLTAIIVSIYIVVCSTVFLKLWPELPPFAKRLAGAMLLAQLLLTLIALDFRPKAGWADWLFSLDAENNIPSILSSAHLALVSAVAFLTAKYRTRFPSWSFAYYVGLGVAFLYFAAEEYSNWRASFDWVSVYMTIGAVLAASICLAAVKAPKLQRKWHISLLIGLAMAAFGSIAIEQLRFKTDCINAGFWIGGSCRAFIIEETLEFLGVWLALNAMLGLFSTAASTHSRSRSRRVRWALYVLPLLWILVVSHRRVIHNAEGLLLAQPASVLFEKEEDRAGLHLYGYQINKNANTLGLLLYASGRRNAHLSRGLSAHLVDQQSGESLANSNEYWEDEVDQFIGPGRLRIYRQDLELELPAQLEGNRAVWLVLSLWRDDGGQYQKQSIISSDHRVLSDSEVILSELVLRTNRAAPASASPLAQFESGKWLAEADLPASAISGETLPLEFAWRSDEDSREDVMQFLHFIHAESGEYWGFDQQPLGARLPTRLWYSGLADSETWAVPLPADLKPGRYQVFTGLYRLADLMRIPATDAEGRQFADMRVPLGEVIIDG